MASADHSPVPTLDSRHASRAAVDDSTRSATERHAAVGRLAARVAHELNNPIDGILRYTNLALRLADGAENPKLADYLRNVRTGILRMAQIVTALLEFSRSAPEVQDRADINSLVKDAVDVFRGRVDSAGIIVTCQLTPVRLPAVRGVNLFQIFCNVVKNALDAMPGGGALNIETAVDLEEVVITFADTGVGLPPDAERIFDAFYTTKEPGKGAGLGLAVCRELVTGYGGRIEARRREPCGAAFVIRIPLRGLDAGAARPRTGRRRLAPGGQ